MKLASGFCIPEPLPVHMGIKGQVRPLIKFYAEEPRWVHGNQRWFKIVACVACDGVQLVAHSIGPLCRHDITAPFPPSGNGGYVRNLDVPYLSITTSYVVTT